MKLCTGSNPKANGQVSLNHGQPSVGSASYGVSSTPSGYSSSPPADIDSKISLHSGHTGYFFGSRLGTQTLPQSAITGVPLTALSMILSFCT